MKRIILLTLLIPVLAHAQRYGHTSAGAAGAGSTASVRANTGWTSNGTTAQDTLATVYRLDKANVRFIVTDADGDTLWFYPQNLHPLILKDGTLLLSGVDSTGRGYFGGNAATAGQTRRAFLNVVGIGDTLLALIGDGDRAVGDSTIIFTNNGKILISGGSATSSGNIVGPGSYISLNNGGVSNVDFLTGTYGAAGTRNFRFMTQSEGVASTGFLGFNRVRNTGTFQNPRSLVDFRSSVPIADTLFIVSNDGNATLDSTLLVHANADFQSASRAGFGVNTSGQGSRAILNAASRAGGDSLLVLTAESNYGVGDSSAVFDQAGRLSIGGAQGSNLRKLAVVSGSNKASLEPTNLLFGTTTTDYSERMTRSGNSFDFYTNTVARFRIATNGYVAVGNNFASSDAAIQAFFTVRANGTADTLMMARNDKNSTLDSTAMVFADGSVQFGTASGGSDAFTTTAETDTVTVVGAGVNDIYTITLKGTAAPAAADLCAVEALAGKFVVHRSAAGTSGLEYYWRRERR